MTQAYNLAILANAVDTSGRLNVATNATGTLPVGNGGTGATGTPSNGQIPIGNGSTYTPATITAGSGISVSNGSGSITISAAGGGVTSLNGQTGAITNTDLDSIGSVSILQNATNSDLGMNGTRAGSSLRYGSSFNTYNAVSGCLMLATSQRTDNSNYPGGGSALSGTWRKMADGSVYLGFDGCFGFVRVWAPSLYVRIS